MREDGRLLINKTKLLIPVPQFSVIRNNADFDSEGTDPLRLMKNMLDKGTPKTATSVGLEDRKSFEIADLGGCLCKGDTTARNVS